MDADDLVASSTLGDIGGSIDELISGIPGAGKSTISRFLTASFLRGTHIEGDRLQEWISSGGVWPGQPPASESDRQLALHRRNQCLLARSYADAGFVPVIDYVIANRATLADYRWLLPDLDFRLVMLDPGPKAALLRDRERPEKTVAEMWVHLEDELTRELGGLGLWIDSRNLNPSKTLLTLLARASEAVIHLPARHAPDLQ